MEISDLRELALNPDRPKQNRWRVLISHRLPLIPYPKLSKSDRAEARQWSNIPYLNGIARCLWGGRDSVEP